jgi:hypothetical protein
MIEIECDYDQPHTHEFPDDWEFGGASGLYFAADKRWRSTTYTYLDDQLREVYSTQVPQCDGEAIDNFTWVAKGGRVGQLPTTLQVSRPDGEVTLLPVRYDPATDTVWDS